ncbi:uncharacterized protein LOC110848835 [Folsomia candida]|uniref:uncharacterized protein LOC110848835 n=1 Tax=Folsomia candida TaxID=158441 RepID=UPI000B8FC57F|nr:uncharacterized protein LOC110848835 [Folsomia candida]
MPETAVFLVCIVVTSLLTPVASSPAKTDGDIDPMKPPLMCYQCSSDPTPHPGHAPVLPYHPFCSGGGILPPNLLVQCDNIVTPHTSVITPFDTVGQVDRSKFIDHVRNGPNFIECGKFHTTETGTTRKGCALVEGTMNKTFGANEDVTFANGHIIKGHYCGWGRCNQGNGASVTSFFTILGMIALSQILL